MGGSSFELLYDRKGLYTDAIESEFSLVFYGRGFTWSDIQNMPVGERALHLRRLEIVLKKEKEDHDKAVANANKSAAASSSKSSVPAPRAPHYRA